MGLVNLSQAFAWTGTQQGALGAFNVTCWEMAPAIIAAAEAADFPVVLQAQWPFLDYAGCETASHFLSDLARRAKVPVVLQVDHAKSWEQIMVCLRHGFSSVMIDASHHPIAENIGLVARIVAAAHPMGVTVESELGRLSGSEGDVVVAAADASFTDPEEASYFVSETGVDALAVSVGTVHGPYQGDPKLDFPRLEEIAAKTGIPLVLHGASGVSESALQRSVSLGVRKVNFSTELRQAWLTAMRHELDQEKADTLPAISTAQQAVRQVVAEKIAILKG